MVSEQICYSSATAELENRQRDLLASLTQAFPGGAVFLVSQALAHPAVRPSALAYGEARGWSATNATWLGKALSAMQRAGAPLMSESRSGYTFWRVVEHASAQAPELPPLKAARGRPAARYHAP